MNTDEYGAWCKERADWMNSLETWDDLPEPKNTPHWVYRYWNDKFDPGHQLMYVGFTGDFWQRDTVHWSTSAWRPFVTRIDMDMYPTRAAARAGEARTIKAEVPLYNIHKNPHREAVHGEWDREMARRSEEIWRELRASGWISPLDEALSRLT